MTKVEDGLFEDVKRVFPVFWKLYTKELGDKKPRKGAMLAFSGTYKTSLMMFCQHVVDISNGKKENDLSSAHRSRQLKINVLLLLYNYLCGWTHFPPWWLIVV